MEKYTNRNEQLADELIRAMKDYESYLKDKNSIALEINTILYNYCLERNLDTTAREEEHNFPNGDCTYKDLYLIDKPFIIAFFKMLGFHSKFAWYHIDEYGCYSVFNFNYSYKEKEVIRITICYDEWDDTNCSIHLELENYD